MSSNNDSSKNSNKADKFLNPRRNMDDDNVEEVTRRVAPAMVQPHFGPMPDTVPTMGSSIITAPVKGTSSSSSPSFGVYVWDLATAPTLPEFHPLERTSVFVPHTSPTIVAERVSNVLRGRSIEAHYDDDKAKVKCITSEGVDFRIRLYTGRNQYNHGVIVEVQRRFGSSVVFHSDTQAILDAAQGKAVPSPPALTSMDVLPPEVSDEECDDDHEDVSGGEHTFAVPSAESSLTMVSKMLSLPGFDSQYLGLQTLSSLVNPEKLSLKTARNVATTLLQSNNEVGLKVFGYIVSSSREQQKKNRSLQRNDMSDDDIDDESTIMSLRNMSLGILANSMRASGKFPEFLREPLRHVLLEDLRNAKDHPNAALLAATCLEYFIRGDHDTMELIEALEVAKEVGDARHANLSAQAKKCIAAIR